MELPLTVDLKDNNLLLIWAGIILFAAAAVFFKWWTMKVADTGASNGADVRELFTWIRGQWVTVVIAVIAAAGGVYIAKFQKADSFVPGDRWELWVATFTAVMTASLLLNALGVAIEPSTDDKPKPPH